MGDPFKKVQAGERLKIAAEAFNTMIDAALDFKARQHGTSSDPKTTFTDRGVVLVKNQSGAARNRFDILGLDAPVISPTDNLDEFKNRPAITGVTPVLPTHVGRFCILLEPLADGAIGHALVSGVCVARVTMIQAGHQFAELVHEDTTRLRSAHAGSVEILWKESGAGGDRWAVVRLGGGELVVRFELLASLAPGGSALARLADDPAAQFLVHDTLGMRRGRARNEGYFAGSFGYARFYHDLGRWEIVEMQPKALVLGARVNESQGVPRGDGSGTFAVDNVELIAPVGGLLDSLPTTARNPLKLRLLDNDPVFLFWNETNLTWDAIGRDRGGTLRHAKVQGTFENQSADLRRSVTVKACDKDGGNVEGDEFTVLTGIAPGFATAIFAGDVVDYIESETGDRIITSKHHDAAFGTVEWLAVDPTNIKRGWQLCDGTNGTADLRDRFVVCYRGGDGKPSRDRNGEVGDYAAVGDTGGYAWHGDSAFGEDNNHPPHPNHRHELDTSNAINIKEGNGAGHWVWQGDISAYTSGAVAIPGDDEPDWAHRGEGSDDTDNRPPYYVLAAIQRVS